MKILVSISVLASVFLNGYSAFGSSSMSEQETSRVAVKTTASPLVYGSQTTRYEYLEVFGHIGSSLAAHGIKKVVSVGTGSGFVEALVQNNALPVQGFDVLQHNDRKVLTRTFIQDITLMNPVEEPSEISSYRNQINTVFPKDFDYNTTALMLIWPKNWGNAFINHYLLKGGQHLIVSGHYNEESSVWGVNDSAFLGNNLELWNNDREMLRIEYPMNIRGGNQEILVMSRSEVLNSVKLKIDQSIQGVSASIKNPGGGMLTPEDGVYDSEIGDYF